MPLIPTLGNRSKWISEFKARMLYRVSYRTAMAIQRNLVSKQIFKNNKEKTNTQLTSIGHIFKPYQDQEMQVT